MRVNEVFGEVPLQYTLLSRLVRKGIPVTFDYVELTRHFTRWHNGLLKEVIHEPGPSPADERFLISYAQKMQSPDGSVRYHNDSVRLTRNKFEKLLIYKHDDEWMLSDRRPSDEDEPL